MPTGIIVVEYGILNRYVLKFPNKPNMCIYYRLQKKATSVSHCLASDSQWPSVYKHTWELWWPGISTDEWHIRPCCWSAEQWSLQSSPVLESWRSLKTGASPCDTKQQKSKLCGNTGQWNPEHYSNNVCMFNLYTALCGAPHHDIASLRVHFAGMY